MSTDSPPRPAPWAPAQARRLDRLCDQFEADWGRAGPGHLRPRIEDLLAGAPEGDRPALVGELVALEVHYRRQSGEVPTLAEYRERFPDFDSRWLARAFPARSDPDATRTGPAGLGAPAPPLLDRFELLAQVGSGGFGTVWRARDTRLGRTVALKVPHAGLRGSPGQLERCHREARAAAQLRHPGVVTVHEVADLGGLPVLVCDFVEGGSLRDLTRTRRLTFSEAATLVADVADAVDYAHTMNVIHRDLKPGNILLEGGAGGVGRPLVTDFGLARREDAEATLTQEGDLIGTPAYMSPEQAAGRGHQVDRRTDVYSLGVVLFELLTGELPFRGPAATLVQQIVGQEPAPPRRVNARVPRDLETVCLRAMAKEPGRRYSTARELAEDLRRWLSGEPVRARRAGRAERAWRWCRRNPRLAALTGTVAGLLVATTTTAVWAAFQAEARVEAEAKAKSELEFNLYLRIIPRAYEEARLNNWGEAEELLKDSSERLRGWEYHLVKRLPNTPLRDATARVNGGISANLALAFSPSDGRLLAGPGPGNTVVVWDLVSGRPPRYLDHEHSARVLCVEFGGPLLASADANGAVVLWDADTLERVGRKDNAHTGQIVGMAFSPDGGLLATVGADDRVWLWHIITRGKNKEVSRLKEFRTEFRTQARMLRRVAFSRTGLFAYGGADNTVKVCDSRTWEERFSLSGHKGLVFAVEFSPEGDRLVSTSWDLTARVWDLTVPGGRELFPPVTGHSAAAWSVAFGPRGDLVAVAGGVADPVVKVYNARTGALVHTLEGHADRVGCVAFHPDGRRLVSCSLDRTIRIWELDRGKEVLTLRGHTDLVTRVIFDPRGWRLASSSDDGALRVWDGTPEGEAPGRPGLRLTGPTHRVFAVAVSRDGLVAAAGADQTIRVWDLNRGGDARTLTGHTATVFALAFLPDGLLVSGSSDQTIRVWDPRAGVPARAPLVGPEASSRSLAVSPDGRLLVTSAVVPPHEVWLWDVRPGPGGPELVKRHPLEGHNGPAFGVAFSSDSKYVATAGTDGKVFVRDAATGLAQGDPLQLKGRTRAWTLAFGPVDGRRLAVGYFSERQVVVWDWRARQELLRLPKGASAAREGAPSGHTDYVFGVTYSPDGRWLASSSWKEVIVWDAQTGEEVRRLDGYPGQIWSVAWSPDGKRLTVAWGRKGVGEIEVWDSAELTDQPARVAPGR